MVEVHTGDAIEIVSNKVDNPSREGVVIDVLEQDPLRLEVRWSDGHCSILQPRGGNVRVVSKA
jgi:hypothetical protein